MTVASDAAEVRSLPPPVLDPEDLLAILPSLTPEEAALYASLATLVLQSVIWPNSIPDPLPPPVQTAGLSIAVRLARAGEAAGNELGSVVSESIGAYTYRLASPATFDSALSLTDAERTLLRPWLGQTSAYDVRTALPTEYAWPPGWWQSDYDVLEYPPGTDVVA